LNILSILALLVPVVLGFVDAANEAAASSEQAGESLANAGGGMKSFIDTLGKAGDGYRDIEVGSDAAVKKLDETAQHSVDTARNMAVLTDTNVNAADKIGGTTAALQGQTKALTENSDAWLINALKTDSENNGLGAIADSAQQTALFEQYGIDLQAAIKAGFDKPGGVTEALRQQMIKGAGGIEQYTRDTLGAAQGADELAINLEKVGGSIDAVNTKLQKEDAISAIIGASAAAGDVANQTADQLATLAEGVKNLFTQFDNQSAFLSAFDTFAAGVREGGTALDQLSESGRTNVANLESVIESSIGYGNDLGLNAADSIAQALYAVNQEGVDTATLLQQLASVPAIFKGDFDISAIIAKYNQIAALGIGGALSLSAQKSNLNSLKSQRDALIAQRDTAASRSGGSGGGGGGGGGGSKQSGGELKTTKEYAGDLKTAMQEAFDKRFGIPKAIDDVTSQFQKMKKTMEDARNEARDLRTELQGLTADRDKLNRQLQVAIDYGDTEREAQIRAELAKNTDEMSDKTVKLDEASAAATATTDGNTEAAINNRASVLDLIGAYQGQIQAYADTGASASEVSAYTATLQQQFKDQLTQLGYNSATVQFYAGTFDVLTAAVNAVPTNKEITVTANTGGASANIANLSGQVNALDAQIDALNGQITAAEAAQRIASDKAVRISQLTLQLTDLSRSLGGTAGNSPGGAAAIKAQMNAVQRQIELTQGNYAKGGIIGGGGRPVNRGVDDVMINAQLGESILTQKTTAWLGADALDLLNRQQNPFAPQVIVQQQASPFSQTQTIVVELSAQDRMLLAEMGNPVVRISGAAIHQVNSLGNVQSAGRGAS
jgi:hypothetical protein